MVGEAETIQTSRGEVVSFHDSLALRQLLSSLRPSLRPSLRLSVAGDPATRSIAHHGALDPIERVFLTVGQGREQAFRWGCSTPCHPGGPQGPSEPAGLPGL
ncbi:MAG: hypothetical protein VKO39_12790 [Cyanobacteriota bacterium]|nr:hypothetical protein [Cyanobacteriota bacterium]